MKTRPIIFNSQMVRAILDGHKTQTRRVVKYNENVPEGRVFKSQESRSLINKQLVGLRLTDRTIVKCPYGVPGEKLWVRETFQDFCPTWDGAWCGCGSKKMITETHQVAYRATKTPITHAGANIHPTKWKPSIHMPRWASRITLEITDVRVERLHEITVGDLIAEGIIKLENAHIETYPLDLIVNRSEHYTIWKKVWDSINAKRGYSFKSNPWVWVIEFKVIDA